MVGVASQIIFCIFAAAVIGSVAGYLIGGLRHSARISDIERLWQAKLEQRDGELARLREAGQTVSGFADSRGVEAPLLQVTKTDTVEPFAAPPTPDEISARGSAVGQFEDKLSEALRLIEKLAQSQARMENEIAALRNGERGDFKLEPSIPKS
jgi:hypothetical protein